MCGIAGILSLSYRSGRADDAQERAVRRMVAGLRHRGPDDNDSIILREDQVDVALGHTRLAIIDLSAAGHQPMVNERERLWMTYNGEIYNFRELRAELSHQGVTWQSHTDTEVLLQGYAQWGLDCLNRLRGMFAFALWDGQLQRLLLARDPFGIKPLYYVHNETTLAFASEVRVLLDADLAPRRLSRSGLAAYLGYGSAQSPLTLIEGVRSLLPGHYLEVKANDGKLAVREIAYADDFTNAINQHAVASRREAVACVRDLLEESTRRHLVSDVPLAAFLSGGIDSSALVALMSHQMDERPKTFSVVFAEQEFSEQSYARLIADKFGTDHHEICLSEESLLQMLPEALAAMDQPTIDGINTFVISKAVKASGITVAISGLGGDELFAGYPSFRRAARAKLLAGVPGTVRRAVARAGRAVAGISVQQRKAWSLIDAGANPQNVYRVSRQLFSSEEIEQLTGSHDRLSAFPCMPFSIQDEQDVVNAVSACELQGYMANMLLRDTDQMSMAHSLEVRVPFIDRALVPFVLGLKGEWKFDGARPKPLLVDALGDLLPEEIWRRPKMGFTLPFERWMRSALRSDIEQTLTGDEGCKNLGISAVGSGIWQKFVASPQHERWSRSWSLYVLKRWCDLHGVTA
jgi:asparagine synthase (glutamine-hydrolysing)